MNKRETFYFTPKEREQCQRLNIDRKKLKKMISLILDKKDQAEKTYQKNFQKMIHAKWIIDDEN